MLDLQAPDFILVEQSQQSVVGVLADAGALALATRRVVEYPE